MSGDLSVRTALLFLLFACATQARAADPVPAKDAPPADTELQYNRDIRPLLAEACFACHGPDSAARKADLRLDQRDAAVEFGAITPGEVDDSQLIARITTDDPDLVMPPPETKKTLTLEQQEMLRRWIAQGAQYQPHWSFIVPEKPDQPTIEDAAWPKNPIDRFVLAKLEASGLAPAPEADPRTLFRRLHLDITGLPPAVEDIEAFVSDYSQRRDDALHEWIDRLMQLPAWGEHRARYWLDAARYADTHGLHFDNYREIWPYRDWVIRAFNANQPFDQFTVEQLAGDLLPDPTDDQLIATGFQRCNITTNEGGTIDEENLALYASDRVQTFGWVFLGLTTNCAQCHDHKFDPFTAKDYYSLAAFFRNTTQPAKDGNVADGRSAVLVIPSEEDRPRWESLPEEIAAATERRDERKRTARGAFRNWLAAATAALLDQDLPADGLVVHVPLTEGSGDHATGSGEPAKIFKATGKITWADDGRLGPAPVMKPGATFELGDLGDFEKDQGFSYGTWIRAARDDVSAGILARMDEQAAYRGWDLWQQNGYLAAHIIDAWPDNALKVSTQKPVLKPGQWQHVFASYDGSGKAEGVKIYVDGKEQPTKVDANNLRPDASIRTKTPLRIGQRSDGQTFAGGAVQDVRIYSRTLPAAEVQSIATVVTLKEALAAPSQQRTPEQQRALYAYYLDVHDPQYPQLVSTVDALTAEREAIRTRSPITHIQQEKTDSQPVAHILMRGEYDRPGEQVAAATPESLHPLPDDAPGNRLGLARWVVDPANPLTARVTVNRFWQQVFGRGIVATAEDFGVMGAQPTHPELLDWLAVEFRDSDWDVKQLFKLMLTSATYRQAAITTPAKRELDHDNALLSRGPRFRMDAEMVRDHALAASGLLSSKMYGPGVKPYQPSGIWDIVGLPGGDTRNYVQGTGEDLYRRTIYSFWKRMAPPPNLEAFNAPSREFCSVSRERTNTPLQALVTLNDPQFVEAARRLAQQALRSHGQDDAEIADYVARRVLGRPLATAEQHVLLADKDAFLAHYRSNTEDAEALASVGQSAVDKDLDVSLTAAWTMVCNQVMNLDEALSK